jgi:hypothetical protein
MTTASRDHATFWCLFAAQAAGAQIIFWVGLPIYRSLLSDRPGGADAREIAIVIAAVAFMQAAYWCAFHLQPRVCFRRNIVLGHVLLWLGEFCFFFPSALAALIVFDRFEQLEIVPWKLCVLAAMLFAMFCYKHQLETLGETMLETGTGRVDAPESDSEGR